MEQIFKDLVTTCWWSWLALLGAVVLMVTLCVGTAQGIAQPLLALGAYMALCAFFSRPLVQAAYSGHRHLLTVCFWSFVLVVLGVTVAYYAYHVLVAAEDGEKYEKFLNIVPVLVAIWAAALGWFVHFRLSTKAHRTNNAFSIIMEMRKSGEYLKRQEAVARHFPTGTQEIEEAYRPYFQGTALKELLRHTPVDEKAVEMAEAVAALRYMLNYFEFVAVGIKEGAVDEDLIYETISVYVVKLFDRSKKLVDYSNMDAPAGAGQPLAFSELKKLVAAWRPRIQSDTAKG